MNSLKWALLFPLLFAAGGFLAQYPYGLIFVGVVVALAALTVAATLIGAVWHRPGAAVLVSVSGMALTFFAGPGLYEVYMETLGEPASAVVAKVEEKDDLLHCTVVERSSREVHEISQQENCFGHVKAMQDVELRKDPLGLLDPRLPDGPGQSTEIALWVSAALFLVTGGATLYAGRRRLSSD